MPMYDYICECGELCEEFRPIAEWNNPKICPVCGELMQRRFAISQAVRGNYKKPIALQSMGLLADPEDVAEHRKRFPDVELRMDNGSAIPVVNSLGQKRAYLKAVGWVDSKSF